MNFFKKITNLAQNGIYLAEKGIKIASHHTFDGLKIAGETTL